MTLPTLQALDPRSCPLDGRHLVEASAGTGKTYTITTLFTRLVVERDLATRQILVVTYTRAAAAELRERIRQRLQDALATLDGASVDPVLDDLAARWRHGVEGLTEGVARRRLARAVQDFDLAEISTIHAWCQKVLSRYAFLAGVGFDLELTEDDRPWLRQVAQDLLTDLTWQHPPEFLSWLDDALPLSAVVDLVGKATRTASVRFLPEVAPAPLEPAVLDAPKATWEALRAAWPREADAVGHLLGDSPVLSGTWYSHRRTPPRIAALSERLEVHESPLAIPALDDLLAYFDPETLSERRKKGAIEAGDLPPTHPLLDRLGALRGQLRTARDAFVHERVRITLEIVRRAPAALEAARGPTRAFFDDLVGRVREALERPGRGARLAERLRQDHPAALIDEFQDTDPVQYGIFRRVYPPEGDGRLFLIGDPKQAIYAFRGADLYAYLGARAEVPAANHHSLGRNYRSDGALVRAVNRLFTLGPAPFVEERVAFQPVDAEHTEARLLVNGKPPAPLHLRFHRGRQLGRRSYGPRAAEIADEVAGCFHALLESKPVLRKRQADGAVEDRPLGAGDLAVLVSSHREAQQVQSALAARGIPAVRYGATSVFDTPEAEELAVFLDGVTTPQDLHRVKSALATPLLGFDGPALAALETDPRALDTQLLDLRRWRRTWEHHGFMRMFQAVLRERAVLERLLLQDGGERRLTNLRHLAELVHTAEAQRSLGVHGVVAWLAARRGGRLSGQDPVEVRLESDAQAVQVVTMHASKGLEYPVVYCPYVWKAGWPKRFPEFHDPAAGDQLTVQLHPEDHPAHRLAEQAENRAERLRLAYVALTRAKHLCFVTWGRFQSGFGASAAHWHEGPLAHLLHPPGADGLPASSTDDDALIEHVRRIAEATPGDDATLRISVHKPAAPGRWSAEAGPSATRHHRQPPPPVGADTRISSFSALVRALDDDPHDHDLHARRAPPEAAAPQTPLPLAALPGGAHVGTFFHAVLEDLDFADPTGAEASALVRRRLREHGLASDLHTPVLAALDGIVRTPLGGDCPPLADLHPDERLDELGFHARMGAVAPFTGARLADALAAHGHDPALVDALVPRWRLLAPEGLRGVLEGYVDLTFRHGGRWFIVDYKTNRLGDHRDAFDAEGVRAAMLHGDYVLQYHLYAVALLRHLRRRQPGFDPDKHWGGVRYLFVRGMDPSTGPTRGVWSDRPSPALLDALDAALDGGAA